MTIDWSGRRRGSGRRAVRGLGALWAARSQLRRVNQTRPGPEAVRAGRPIHPAEGPRIVNGSVLTHICSSCQELACANPETPVTARPVLVRQAPLPFTPASPLPPPATCLRHRTRRRTAREVTALPTPDKSPHRRSRHASSNMYSCQNAHLASRIPLLSCRQTSRRLARRPRSAYGPWQPRRASVAVGR